jgi:hypothetical protein
MQRKQAEYSTPETKNITQAIRNNNCNLGYSSHVLNMGHAYKTITDTMSIVRTRKRKTLKHIRKIPHIQNQ